MIRLVKRQFRQIIIITSLIVGLFNRLMRRRRSSYDWPDFDSSFLWYIEESKEYSKDTTSIDEYLDVIGSLVILKVIHKYRQYHYCDQRFTDDDIRKGYFRWYIRQNLRGRRNLSYDDCFSEFLLMIDICAINNTNNLNKSLK